MIEQACNFAERNFLSVSLIVAVVIYISVFPYNSMYPDESSNLLLGRNILDGNYPNDFLQRMPLLPIIASLSYAVGLDAYHIKFLVPLAFTILSLLSVYLLAGLVCGKKTAMWSVVLLLSFPIFWRWTIRFMQDIPLLVMVTFGFYFYYITEKCCFFHGFFLGRRT